MSTIQTVQIHCPSCSEIFSLNQHVLVNPSHDPIERAQLLTGDLFNTICPHCGHQQIIAYNTTYHDTKQKFMVTLRADRSKPTGIMVLPGVAMRVEYTLSDFVERVRILDKGLDDMSFELFRLVLRAQLQRQFPDKPPTRLRFQALENDQMFLQVQGSEQIQVPYASYQSIADKVKAAGYPSKYLGFLHLDAEWVQSSGITEVLSQK